MNCSVFRAEEMGSQSPPTASNEGCVLAACVPNSLPSCSARTLYKLLNGAFFTK